jgi:hypothetical protein
MVNTGTMSPDPTRERTADEIRRETGAEPQETADERRRRLGNQTQDRTTTTTTTQQKPVDLYSDVYDERSAGEGLSDLDFLEYVTTNPDLREHVEALGLTSDEASDWGRWHWYNHGKAEMDEGRRLTRNAPGDIQNEALAKTKWQLGGEVPKVYSDLGLKSLEDILAWSLGQMTPSELWETRAKLSDDWNLLNFNPEGWRFEADNPYRRGLLGGNISVDENVGQLLSEGDKQFIQDRYNDAFIRNDFPEGWVDAGGNWQGPPALAGYWNTLTNSYRNAAGDLRAPWDVPDTGWGDFIPPVGLGPRGRTGISGPGYGSGISREYLATPYTRPDIRDLSHLAPPPAPGLLGSSPTQRALLGGRLEAWQPEALGGVFDYKPRGATTMSPSAWVPPVIDPVNANINNTNNINNNSRYVGPLGGEWNDYHDWYMNSPLNPSIVNNHRAALDRIKNANNANVSIDPATAYLAEPITMNTGQLSPEEAAARTEAMHKYALENPFLINASRRSIQGEGDWGKSVHDESWDGSTIIQHYTVNPNVLNPR